MRRSSGLGHCRDTHGVSAELNGDVDGVEGFAEQAAKGLERSLFDGSVWGGDPTYGISFFCWTIYAVEIVELLA